MSGLADRLNQRENVKQKGKSAQDGTRQREDTAVQVRKAQKEEALNKKRQTDDSDAEKMGVTIIGNEQVQSLCPGLVSEDPTEVFNTTQQFRKMLSIEHNPPIQEVIQAGIVPRFVALLKETSKPDLQFEAAWVLTNIASGTADQTRCVVEHGALPIFVELLRSPNEDVKEQAVWALGNIAGDSPNFRDLVLQSGGMEPVLAVITGSEKISIIRNATWTLSNLCRGKPQPPLQWVLPGLACLSNLIQATDVEVLADSSWALTYLSDGSEEHINAVIQAGVVKRLIELFGHQSPTVQTPVLRAIGNIVTGNDVQTQTVIDNGCLPALFPLLDHTKKAIRKECCWTISNITAGNRDQIQAVIDAGLIPPIIKHLAEADFDVKKEAAWAISNATMGGSPAHIEYLIGQGCLGPLIELLSVSDSKTIVLALDTLDNLLKVGKQQQEQNNLPENPITTLVESQGGLSKIEELQEHANEEIYGKASALLETYFELQDEAGQEEQFQFGAQMPAGGFDFGAGMS